MSIPASDAVEIQVQVPEGAAPGQQLQVQIPSGQTIQVVIPPGAVPGSSFSVQAPGVASAGDEDVYEAYEPLPDIVFDVTDPFESTMACLTCPCMGYPTRSLILSDQEVTFRQKNLCGARKQKRPYAQLGSVDKHTTVWGCHTIASDFAPVNEKGEGGIRVGCCGTDSEAVTKIVETLQMRKGKRGGIAQIRKLDYIIGKLVKIGIKVPLLLYKLSVPHRKKAVPTAERNTLDIKTFDITNYIELVLGCTTRSLRLDENEASIEIQKCFGCQSIRSKREYGELGFVEKKKNCICCFHVASDISPIPGQSDMAPGCPCTNRAKVSMLVRELRDRMAARGQVGQIKKQEKILGMIADVGENLKILVDREEITFPPSQQEMAARFGENIPNLNFEQLPIEHVQDKIWDVTSTIDSICTCLCTCGIAGCTKETMDLKNDVMYIKVKNNLDDSDMKIPYAEMDSVDTVKFCCCCHSVNDQTPGCGCQKTKVKQIAEDLQERKFKRGNIAHLKQLRSMQGTAVGVDMMAEKLLEKYQVEYPPSQQVMDEVFPGQKPRALTHNDKAHLEPDREFDSKTYYVTNYPSSILGCLCCPCQGWTSQKLELQPDEMLLVTDNFCSTTNSRIPYGNMGSVESETFCCCCSGLPDIAIPGCGCSNKFVEEIAGELQERKVKRGNIAQMKQQENICIEVLNLEAKVDMLIHNRGVEFPAPAEVMAEVFLPAEGPINYKQD